MREVAKRIVNLLPEFSTKPYFSIAKNTIVIANMAQQPIPCPLFLGLNSIRTASIHLFSPL